MNPLVRVTCAVALIIMAIAPTSGATAGSTVDGSSRFKVERLTAEWILRGKGGSFQNLFVHVTRMTDLDTNDVAVSASAGVGECFQKGTDFGCVAYPKPHKVLKIDLAADYRSATVVLRRGRVRHRVSWTAGMPFPTVPPVGVTPEPCPGGEGTLTRTYLLNQNATAKGRVFGRNVSTADEYDEQRESEKIHISIDQKDCP